jgi:hypothetical protein
MRHDANGDAAKRILMIAFHYPPCRGSSGLQRTLSFSRYLPAYGWEPIILSAHPRAYPESANDQLGDIPATVPVTRALAWDSARHLSFQGRFISWTGLPDRWVTWLAGAIPAGLRLIRKYRPRVLWSTYPIATAHLIGLALHRLTGLPWVADFRDPMTELDPQTGQRWPADPAVWKLRTWVERQAVNRCARAVFVTPTALRLHTERYPRASVSHWALIPNGYDEEQFAAAERTVVPRAAADRRTVLLHSGILYRSPDRDPSSFFSALGKLKKEGKISAASLKVVLRACGYEEDYRRLIREQDISDIVFLEPAIPYRDSLAEMLGADGLLLFQGHDSNPAIPAKFYEYLRARRPIFAMVDSAGDTATALVSAGIGKIVPLDSPDKISAGLVDFLGEIHHGETMHAEDAEIRKYSRQFQASSLAKLLDEVAA